VTLADEAGSLNRKPDPAGKHPPGWQPGMTWAPGKGGEIVTAVTDSRDADPAFWEMVIADWGLDPQLTEIVPDSVQIRAWDMNVGGGNVVRARYYKANIRPRRNAITTDEAAELDRVVMRRRTRRTPKPTGPGVAYVLNLSDFQIGKGEGGGTSATIERIMGSLNDSVTRVGELRKTGRSISSIVIAGLGDLAEQCIGHYPSQQFTVDRTRRQQLQIVRELITLAIDLHADLAPTVQVVAVPGNHGENRANGKSITTIADNDDLAVFEQVSEALAKNPGRYSHVAFRIADGLVEVVDVEGVAIAWTHMHQGNGSGERALEAWWRGQVMGNHPVARAQILNTAHYHHFMCSEATGRTIIQVPAMDGGSGWWTDKTGQSSPAGMVSYLAGTGCGPRGWSDLAILGG
jgi:hypothetical protein